MEIKIICRMNNLGKKDSTSNNVHICLCKSLFTTGNWQHMMTTSTHQEIDMIT